MKPDEGKFQKTSKTLWGLVGGLSVIVTIVSGWGAFKQFLNDMQGGISNLFGALVSWFTSSVSLPIWAFFLLIILGFTGMAWLISKLPIRQQALKEPITKRVKFRDLWLFVEQDDDKSIPKVLNHDITQAKCGECMGRIVSTDVGQHSHSPIEYLKCEKGHFVGSETKYEDYKKELDAKFDQLRLKNEQDQKIYKEAREKLSRDLQEGRVTEEDYRKAINAPPQRTTPIPNYSTDYPVLDTSRAYSAEEFYARLIADFQEIYLRNNLEKIEAIPLEKLKQ